MNLTQVACKWRPVSKHATQMGPHISELAWSCPAAKASWNRSIVLARKKTIAKPMLQ